MNLDPAMETWRKGFKQVDRCPWPGPRPLRAEDVGLLIGRTEDRKRFLRALRQHRLVLLHGPSGVGKTSLLQAGLSRDLDRNSYHYYTADKWGGQSKGNDRAFLASKLKLPQNSKDAFEALDEAAGSKAVIVLDQFEELVRYSPASAQRIFAVLLELNATLDIRIVVSFRSEYLHEFAELEAKAVNFSVTQLPLRQVVADEFAESIVLSANKRSDAVDPDVANVIAKAWVAAAVHSAGSSAIDDPFNRVGLLHLQALLYHWHFAGKGQRLTAPVLCLLLQQSEGEPEHTGPQDIKASDLEIPHDAFTGALQQALIWKLQHCQGSSTEAESGQLLVDGLLRDGARWMLGRMVPHLSSAGYKLIRGVHELAGLTLGVDGLTLGDGLAEDGVGPTPAEHAALLDEILSSAGLGDEDGAPIEGHDSAANHQPTDLLSSTREALAAGADARLRALKVRGRKSGEGGQQQSDEDHDAEPTRVWVARQQLAPDTKQAEVTSGAMMGMPPAAVLIEELRRFALALVWLEAASLGRITRPMGSSTMVSLIHDGFGKALNAHVADDESDPSGPLSAITAPRGVSLAWSHAPARVGDHRNAALDGSALATGLPVVNMRWRGGWVMADLAHVVFVNCDLRGTLFDRCRMTGVSFVNCLLDGAIFSDCVISGSHQWGPEQPWQAEQPVFVVPVPTELVRSHSALRGAAPPASTALLADLPGSPAVPYDSEASIREGVALAPLEIAGGGLTIHGGRISSLVLRGCIFGEGSFISFRSTTGTGLEMVELTDSLGQIEIVGSALRHVNLSAVDRGVSRVQLSVRECFLSQVYVGRGIQGSIDVARSSLIQAWNGSSAAFSVTDSTIHGLVGVTVENCEPAPSGVQSLPTPEVHTRATSAEQIADRLARMDYRRDPTASTAASGDE